MTENTPERRPEDDPVHHTADDWEEAGLPAQEDTTEDMILPAEQPVAMGEEGTTGTDKEAGEPHDLAFSRERPDFGERPDASSGEVYQPEHAGEAGTPDPTSRLVSEDEGARTDTEKDLVADDVNADRGGFSAEEQAVHLQPEDNPRE